MLRACALALLVAGCSFSTHPEPRTVERVVIVTPPPVPPAPPGRHRTHARPFHRGHACACATPGPHGEHDEHDKHDKHGPRDNRPPKRHGHAFGAISRR